MKRKNRDVRSDSHRDDPSSELLTEIEHLEQLLDGQPDASPDSVQRLRAAWASARLEEQRAALERKSGPAGMVNQVGRRLGRTVRSFGSWMAPKGADPVKPKAATVGPAPQTFVQPPREEPRSAPAPPSEAAGPAPPPEPRSAAQAAGDAPGDSPSGAAGEQTRPTEKARGPGADYWSQVRRRAERRELSRQAPTVRWNKEAAATLGVAPNASAEQVRTAYIRLARLYHPDMATGASTAFRLSTNTKMKEINAAYRELMGKDYQP